MTGPSDRCPTCGNQGIDSWHLSRCAYLDDVKKRVELHAARYDVPAVVAFDLYAHMRTINSDAEQAYQRFTAVLDLGWRPSVPMSNTNGHDLEVAADAPSQGGAS